MSSKKLRVGVDLDEVIADFISSFLEWYNIQYGTTYTTEDVWDHYLPNVFNKPLEEILNDFTEFFKSPFFDNISLIGGAREGIMKLHECAELYLITARVPEWKEKTKRWIATHIGDVFEDIIFTTFKASDKYQINPSRSLRKGIKNGIIDNLQLNYMIEDNIDFVEGYDGKAKILLFTQPWNRGYKTGEERVIRVRNWEEVVRYICSNNKDNI